MRQNILRGFPAIYFFIISFQIFAQDTSFRTPFEQQQNTSATYQQTINYFQKLAKHYPEIELKESGTTDSGHPLHIAILSKDGDFDIASLKQKGKRILFVNNAIHPGEPCGVDATMMLFRDFASQEVLKNNLENVVVVAIPLYNISGALNRNSHSRANQNGPVEYGFRGNIKNLDLNRDFIKSDTKNAQSFNRAFTEWQPDVFIDNHTSNGADYQYVMTMIATQKDKLNPILSEYVQSEMLPGLFSEMKQADYEMTPYVNVFGRTPDRGIAGFLDLPRYSSGYAALHNCISFIPETHMLKPFEDRVKSTYAFMKIMIETMNRDHEKIGALKAKAIEHTIAQKDFDLNWEVDRTKEGKLLFKGYEGKYKKSEVTGLDRLYYDHNAPFEKEIPFWNTYKATLTVEKPAAYIIPQAYDTVIERLKNNGVQVHQLKKDYSPEVEMYYIRDFKSRNAYEGHYLHHSTQVEKKTLSYPYRKGDYLVITNQASNRYIVETLEPQAPDSWFSWNFFDGILMQKEYFSPYVFEDIAAEFLKENPEVRTALEAKKIEDEEFAKSQWAMLAFVYRQMPHYEWTHQLYPVGRLMEMEEGVIED